MTTCVRLVRFVPAPPNVLLMVVLLLVSTAIMAVGVFLYISAGLIPLPTEGFLLAAAQITKYKFAALKVIADVSMVVLSLVTCLAALHALGSIGLGTIVSALPVGNKVKLLSRKFGPAVHAAMGDRIP